jgi:long-subunit fatty acid transport protein
MSGLSPSPAVMATYRLPGILKQLGVGIGVWSPPGVMSYTFPDPRSYPASANGVTVAENTPQRYLNISQSTIVVFPSVGLSWRPVPWVSVGGTLQYVVSSVALTTALASTPILTGPTPSNTADDIIANIKVNQKPNQWTGIAGLIVSPTPDLIFSASFRPTVPIESTGPLNVQLGSAVQELSPSFCPLTAKLTACPAGGTGTNNAELLIKLPPVLRAGASYKWKRLSSAFEVVWEGWSVNNKFNLTTNAQTTVLGMTSPVGSIQIANYWQDATSGRVGFGYDFIRPEDLGFQLQGNIGAIYESNAIPSQRQGLPYITGALTGGSLGVSAGWHGFALNLSAMVYVPETFTVTNSVTPYPFALAGGTPSGAIGNGTYTTNIWVLGIGLSYHGLGEHI